VPPKTKTPPDPDKTLGKLAAQLAKLAEASPAQRFTQLGDITTAVTTGLALARQDAVLQWVDELTTGTARRAGLSRTEAVRQIIERTHLARTTVFNVLLAAERRYGRPRHAVGRPRREDRPTPPGDATKAPRLSHAGHDHPATPAGRAACRKALNRAYVVDVSTGLMANSTAGRGM
jgi:hypothetical protein